VAAARKSDFKEAAASETPFVCVAIMHLTRRLVKAIIGN
jgi:hypothetical protein